MLHPKNMLQPHRPITATSCQWLLSSTPKVGIVETMGDKSS